MLIRTGCSNLVVISTEVTDDSRRGFEADFSRILKGKPETLILDCSEVDPVTPLHVCLVARAFHSCVESGIRLQLKKDAFEPVDISDLPKLLECLDCISIGESSPEVLQPLESASVATSFVWQSKLSVKAINQAVEEFLLFVSRFPVPGQIVFELRTGLYEVLTNIRIHSGMESDEVIVICVQLIDAKVVIAVIDSGIPFDPTGYGHPVSPENAARKRQKRDRKSVV